MPQLRALPVSGEVFFDSRGEGRLLRLTWHADDEGDREVVVLSLWRGDSCTGTFRLERSDVPAFVDALVEGLSGGRVPRPRTPAAGLEVGLDETGSGELDCRAG